MFRLSGLYCVGDQPGFLLNAGPGIQYAPRIQKNLPIDLAVSQPRSYSRFSKVHS